ncbi:MAG TPA: hypothetical protein VKA84_15125 [Gemmatimonadaceae bacterium]|nr:hypothetical protein [Gemmatimonadaceae bacterium]
MANKDHSETSAGDRAHGTHGKGDARETANPAQPRPEPHDAGSRAQEQPLKVHGDKLDPENVGGSTGWGGEASGGSTIDKRSEKKGRDR